MSFFMSFFTLFLLFFSHLFFFFFHAQFIVIFHLIFNTIQSKYLTAVLTTSLAPILAALLPATAKLPHFLHGLFPGLTLVIGCPALDTTLVRPLVVKVHLQELFNMPVVYIVIKVHMCLLNLQNESAFKNQMKRKEKPFDRHKQSWLHLDVAKECCNQALHALQRV
jgi:hypothetical protein